MPVHVFGRKHVEIAIGRLRSGWVGEARREGCQADTAGTWPPCLPPRSTLPYKPVAQSFINAAVRRRSRTRARQRGTGHGVHAFGLLLVDSSPASHSKTSGGTHSSHALSFKIHAHDAPCRLRPSCTPSRCGCDQGCAQVPVRMCAGVRPNTASSPCRQNGVSRLAATGRSGFRQQIEGLGWPRANLCIDTRDPRDEAPVPRAGSPAGPDIPPGERRWDSEANTETAGRRERTALLSEHETVESSSWHVLSAIWRPTPRPWERRMLRSG
jgi:hypothetical protein